MKDRKKSKRSTIILDDEKIKSLLAESHEGELTLQQVGDMFEVTRMRICQIEKNSLKKLADLDKLKSLI